MYLHILQTYPDICFFQVKKHEGDIEKSLKQISESLSATNANLQKALGPEGQKQVGEIKTKLEQGLKEAANAAERLSKSLEPEANSKFTFENLIIYSNRMKTKPRLYCH